MRYMLAAILCVAAATLSCTGEVEVHGVPKSIRIIWPDCEPGETLLCTRPDASADGSAP